MPAVAEKKKAQSAMLKQYESADDPVHEEPSPAPVAEPAPAPEPVKHPGWLLRAAKAAKIEDSEIAEMDRSQLERAVELSKTHFEDMRRHEQPRPRGEDGRFVKPEEQPEEPFNLKMLGLDPKKWDETEEIDGVVKPKVGTEGILTDALAPLVKEIKALRQELAQVKQAEQNRAVREHENELDKLFASKPELFGKGGRSDLKPNSPEWKRRAAVARAMQAESQSESNLTFSENFRRQVDDLYPSTPQPETPKERPDPHGFQNGTTRQPTARAEAPRPKGPRAAADYLQERFLGGGTDHRAPEADEDP